MLKRDRSFCIIECEPMSTLLDWPENGLSVVARDCRCDDHRVNVSAIGPAVASWGEALPHATTATRTSEGTVRVGVRTRDSNLGMGFSPLL